MVLSNLDQSQGVDAKAKILPCHPHLQIIVFLLFVPMHSDLSDSPFYPEFDFHSRLSKSPLSLTDWCLVLENVLLSLHIPFIDLLKYINS